MSASAVPTVDDLRHIGFRVCELAGDAPAGPDEVTSELLDGVAERLAFPDGCCEFEAGVDIDAGELPADETAAVLATPESAYTDDGAVDAPREPTDREAGLAAAAERIAEALDSLKYDGKGLASYAAVLQKARSALEEIDSAHEAIGELSAAHAHLVPPGHFLFAKLDRV